MDSTEGMIVSSLDQDWASAVEAWDNLTPEERGEIGEYLVGNRDWSEAPELVRSWTISLAQIGYMETGLRWAKRNQDEHT